MSLTILKIKIEARIRGIASSQQFLRERMAKTKEAFTVGCLTGKADGLDDERHTLENLLKYLDNLLEQSENLDVEPQNSPVEQPSFLLCAKVNNEQNTSIHL